MNREFKRKLIGSIIGVTLFAALVVGATYAWLVVDLNVINANYVSRTGCFVIDYNLANSDGLTNNISGSLIPSTDALGGLTGRVGLKTNSSCNLNGVGTLKLHINDEINSALTTSVGSYCENRSTLEPMTGNDAPSTESACKTAGGRWHNYGDSFCESNSTLERLTNYTDSASCSSNGGTWKTCNNGNCNVSPLKYAVYDTDASNALPVSVGRITSSDVGTDKVIYENIGITSTQAYYYVYIWLDGYLTDNTVSNLPFSGYISASATQTNNSVHTVNFNHNLFLTSNGHGTNYTYSNVNVVYDADNQYITLNGTANGAGIEFGSILNTVSNEGDIYEITLKYISGTFSSSVNPVFVMRFKKDNANYPSVINGVNNLNVQIPASDSITDTLTVTSSITDSNSIYLFIYHSNANGVFDNYKIQVLITKQQSKEVLHGSAYGGLPTPAKSGYTFGGWYTEVGGGTKITSSTIMNTSDNHTLYAHWQANS